MEAMWLDWEVYSSQHPISTGTWGTGVMKVRNGSTQATMLAMEGNAENTGVTRGISSCTLQPLVVSVETRELPNLCACSKLWADGVIGTVYQIYLVINHIITYVT